MVLLFSATYSFCLKCLEGTIIPLFMNYIIRVHMFEVTGDAPNTVIYKMLKSVFLATREDATLEQSHIILVCNFFHVLVLPQFSIETQSNPQHQHYNQIQTSIVIVTFIPSTKILSYFFFLSHISGLHSASPSMSTLNHRL